MSSFSKRFVRDAGIYYLKAVAFAVISYLLLFAIYGGVGISFLPWAAVVILAFTIAYIPFFARFVKAAKGDEGS